MPAWSALPSKMRGMTYTLAAPVTAELEIRKSRFIAHALPVADRAAEIGRAHV